MVAMSEPLDSGKPAELSISEQLARRFETYADDIDTCLRKGYDMKGGKVRQAVRVEMWREAASELRSIEAQHDKLGVKLAIVSKATGLPVMS